MAFALNHLSNKLPIVTYDMPHVRTVAINFITAVGSRYEGDGEEGISHFLEHMAFKGTHNRSAKQIAEEFDAIGGYFNAYTSKEHTVYYAKVLDIHIEKALDILSDIILNSKFEEEDIKKERYVIEQEIAQTQDNPDELAYENLVQMAFREQPLGKPILGTSDSIKNFDQDSFKNFTAKYYSSNNCVLSIAGNIGGRNIIDIAEKNFGSLSEKPKLIPNAALYTGGAHIKVKELEQANIFLAFKGVSYQDVEEFYIHQIYSLLLGGGISSRLFQNIREKEGLAYSIGTFNTNFVDTGIFTIYAATAHDKVQYVIDRIIEEIHISIDNITPGELERAKLQIEACILMSEEKTSFKSEEIGKNFMLFNRFISSEEVLGRIREVDLNAIKNNAIKIFQTTATSRPTLSILSSQNHGIDEEYITQKMI